MRSAWPSFGLLAIEISEKSQEMAVIALIDNERSIRLVIPWACEFAQARSTSLTVACWTRSPVPTTEIDAQAASQELVQATQEFFAQFNTEVVPEVLGVRSPTEQAAAASVIQRKSAELLVVAASDPTGMKGSTFATNPLLKQSTCNTVVLFGDSTRSTQPNRIFVAATDNVHDSASVFLADRLASQRDAQVTLARAEPATDAKDVEVGRRELHQLLRNAGIEGTEHLECRVFQTGDQAAVTTEMDNHDLVLMGANCPLVPAIIGLTHKPTVAVIKRAPPLRLWHTGGPSTVWNPRLSPADYAELIQGLRHGSRLDADFVTMLSLASVVASMGLLQNSPAVIIGSMLLAPLMTPMIGCGLSLAQANMKLGRSALFTVIVGLLCSLAISFVVGLIAPGAELTPEIYARGEPTALDLVVAVASAAAAAYALARPSLVGSIAGVAIATALVPPLCSVGLSLAYQDMTNALGAALLFTTNFLAIVLTAALTFRLIGITADHAGKLERRWVLRTASLFGISVMVACIPLHRALQQSLVETKPQPRAFPLAKSVMDALEDRIESQPNVSLITAGRPSSQRVPSDVVVVIGTTGDLEPAFGDELIGIVRREMLDDTLVVDIHCVNQQWHQRAK